MVSTTFTKSNPLVCRKNPTIGFSLDRAVLVTDAFLQAYYSATFYRTDFVNVFFSETQSYII